MERWACADVPCLALQVLLDAHPDWREHPVAVVDRDVAQGVILEVNRNARAFEIRPGMRYAAGLSLSRDLRAGVVESDDVRASCERLVEELHLYSPHVEPDEDQPGLFWLRATGLDRLFGGFDGWASELYEHVRTELGLVISVTVGWTRFGTFATSRSESAGWRVFDERPDEREFADRVPIDLLGLPTRVVEKLDRLAVATVGEFRELPSSGVRKRFGPEAAELWDFAHGQREVPLQPVAIEAPVESKIELDDPMWDSTRLTFLLKSELHPLLLDLAGRHCDLKELTVSLTLEDGDERELTVRPATPTLEEHRVVELFRLKLDRLSLPAGIVRVDLSATGVRIHRDQSHLFGDNARRDLHVANHALARIQAEFGDESVCTIEIRDRHLPESTFELVPLESFGRPSPFEPNRPALVRRIYGRPQPLPRFDPDVGFGWLVRDLDQGLVSKTHGPFRVSGGWWADGLSAVSVLEARRRRDSDSARKSTRAKYFARDGEFREERNEPSKTDLALRAVAPHRGEIAKGTSRRHHEPRTTSHESRNTKHAGVARDYWYAETDRGDVFWIYWDYRRRQWFLHGVVE